MVGARYRTRVATNYTSVAAAEATAESAINLAIAIALPGLAGPQVNFPLRCRMPGGERVLVTIEEETGKIDLNTASPSTLTRFFTALTRDQSLGARIAGRIVELRNPKTNGYQRRSNEHAVGPRFATIMQLDQIDGISPRLFRFALRLVTVRSGRPEPDPDAASPALRQLLSLEQKPTSPARGLPIGGSVTIRADVRSSDGARFIREALVSLAAGRQAVSGARMAARRHRSDRLYGIGRARRHAGFGCAAAFEPRSGRQLICVDLWIKASALEFSTTGGGARANDRSFELRALLDDCRTRLHHRTAFEALQIRQRVQSPAFVDQLLGSVQRKSFIAISGKRSDRQPVFQACGPPGSEPERGSDAVASHQFIDG